MKSSDAGFAGFGEAYFSTVMHRHVKGWKRHNRMTLNFVVPRGDIQVSVRDESSGLRRDFRLGEGRTETYGRLTIPPGLWVAFGGIGEGANLLLNLASLLHDPTEADNRPIDTFPWQWISA
jgi:dTDP-4-dehydrorhamnose 3,5-epimerase